MKKVIVQIYKLPFAEKWTLLRALNLAFFLRIGFKTIGFNKTIKILKLFGNYTQEKQAENLIAGELEVYQKLIQLAYKFPAVIFNCLSVCTSYWWIMRKKGIVTQMKFGMLKQDGKLKAHAWLNYNGKTLTLNPEIELIYTPFGAGIL